MVYFIPKEEKRAGNSALFYAYLLSHGSARAHRTSVYSYRRALPPPVER